MKIEYQGRTIECEEVEVLTSNELWNTYQLADGTILSTKTVLVSVAKAISEKNPDGTALYITKAQTIVKAKESGR